MADLGKYRIADKARQMIDDAVAAGSTVDEAIEMVLEAARAELLDQLANPASYARELGTVEFSVPRPRRIFINGTIDLGASDDEPEGGA